jgi:hypothetical protein
MSTLPRLASSFGWLTRPYQWLIIGVLTALAVTLGVSAYPPPGYQLGIGYHDTPFVRNASNRTIRTDLAQPRSLRWLRDGSAISISGISANYPITVSIHATGADRKEAVRGQLPLTVTINGRVYPPVTLLEPAQWFSWRVEPDALRQGRLDILLNVPNQTTAILVWPQAMIADVLTITPAQPAPADPDWRYILYLAAIVLLTYSFFPLARQRWLMLAGLLLSGGLAVGLAFLLHNDLPTFAAYAGAIALALLLVRLLVPLLGTGPPQHAGRWLFLLTLAVGLLFAVPDFQSSDDALKYMTAESLLTRGTLQLPPRQLDLGSHYSRYPLGHSVAELPLLAAALGWQGLTGAPDAMRYAAVILLDPVASAFAVLLLFLIARRLFSARVAVALSLVYFFATFALPYATQSWSEPLLSALLLLAFYAMLRAFDPSPQPSPARGEGVELEPSPARGEGVELEPSPARGAGDYPSPQPSPARGEGVELEPSPARGEGVDRRWLLVAGAALGYLLFTKDEYALVAAIFGLWWLARRFSALGRAGIAGRPMLATLLREGLLLAMPIVFFYGLDDAYNYIRSGNPFLSGHLQHNIVQLDTPLWTGAYGLLLSPGKGLLWYAPPVLLGFVAFVRFWRTRRWEAALVAALFVPALLLYSVYWAWEGGVSWGPRYLLPYVPLLILVSGAALQGWAGWRGWQRGGYRALVVIGGVVAIVGMMIVQEESWWYGCGHWGSPECDPPAEFDPAHSPILNAFRLLRLGYLQAQTSTQLSYYHLPAFAEQLAPALLIALAAIAACWVGRNCFAEAAYI